MASLLSGLCSMGDSQRNKRLNTQTHVLMACAVLVPAAPTLLHGWTPRWQYRAAALAAIVGALIPDASLFFMWGLAKFQGVPESVIWSEWYYSEQWQHIGALTNSIPVFTVVAVFSMAIRQSLHREHTQLRGCCALLAICAVAALLHALTDLPLHRNDGHPHFWPLSNWVFASPVSYWDRNHYGHYWTVFEWVLATVFIVLLWRRFKNRFTRACLIIAAMSYAAVMFFWLNAF